MHFVKKSCIIYKIKFKIKGLLQPCCSPFYLYMNRIGVSINQIARKANETHDLYAADIEKMEPCFLGKVPFRTLTLYNLFAIICQGGCDVFKICTLSSIEQLQQITERSSDR